MRRSILLILLAAACLFFAGCASATKFNQTYMPQAEPNQPTDKITLTSEDSRIISKYLAQPKMTNHIGLHWLAGDKIYLNLDGSSVIAINPSQKKAQELLDSQAEEAKKQIAQRVHVSLDFEGKGAIRQFAASVFSYGGQKFIGEINDNQQKIGVDVKTFEQRQLTDQPKCESVKLKGQLTHEKNKVTDIEWDYNCAWVPQSITIKKVPQLLSQVQVSPSGKYYLSGSRLYSAAQNSLLGDLLAGYSNVVAVSVNPQWTKIAVLRNKGKNFWVELFPVTFNDQARPATEKIDL